MNVCTSSILSRLGTSLGLAQTTGYSPYMPLLALVVATRWFHLCQVNSSFLFITANWFLVLLILLTALDLLVDLIPAVSSGWHAVHTAITPFIGGFIAAATGAGILSGGASAVLPAGLAQRMDLLLAAIPAAWLGTISILVMFLAGFLLSGLVHLHRTGGRAVANVGHVFTLGLSNVIVSVLEDIAAVVSILLSFLAPVFMLVVVVLVVLILLVTSRSILRGLRFLRKPPQTETEPQN